MTSPNPSPTASQDVNPAVPAAAQKQQQQQQQQTQQQGEEKPGKDEAKLTGAELKKRAKAEKAARRAKEKEDRGGGGGAAPGASSASGGATPKKQSVSGPGGASAGPGGGGGGGGRRGSTAAPEKREKPEKKEDKREDKKVAVFGHLYGQQRRASVAGAGKEVHPAVLALGLQMRDYVVCGSSSRCVATLLAFKRVFPPFYVHVVVLTSERSLNRIRLRWERHCRDILPLTCHIKSRICRHVDRCRSARETPFEH